MSYSQYEQSVEDGRSRYRVLFVIGTTEYRVSNDTMIIADSNGTWEPAAMVLSEFSQTNEMAKDPLDITLPRDHAIALLFQGGVPEQVVSVTVYKYHWHDTDEEFRFYWRGRVAGAGGDGDVVKLSCENIFSSLRRPGLGARYQKSCRHPLYNRGCGLDRATFAIAATVTAASGFFITVSVLDSSIDVNYFKAGMLETEDGAFRYITKQDGNTLTLIRPLLSLEDEVNSSAGVASVTLYPGCNHTMSDCTNKFNNLLNYGGFPWMPGKNPFGNNVTGSIA